VVVLVFCADENVDNIIMQASANADFSECDDMEDLPFRKNETASSESAIILAANIQCTDKPLIPILSRIRLWEMGGETEVALWGALTIAGVLIAILSRWLSPLAALVLIPVLASLASGFGLRTSGFIISGHSKHLLRYLHVCLRHPLLRRAD
jgi:hypothetical protein